VRRTLLFVIAAGAAGLLAAGAPVPGWSATPPPATGSIQGTVLNLTGGKATPVAGQTVTLTTYVNDAEVDRTTTTTDSSGRFTFSVAADPARTYVANVKYKGGDYDSLPVRFEGGERTRGMTLRVYEPTTDPAVVRVNVHHMIVEPGAGVVRVTELLLFANPTDRTYIGATVRPDGRRETLRFRLPDGATDIAYLDGLMECCVFPAPGGFVDTMDIKPGTREIGFSYTVPSRGGRATVVRTLDFPTDLVEVFGDPTVRLTAAAPLAEQPPVRTEQGTYSRFSARALAPGTPVSLTLVGLPTTQGASRRLLVAAFAGLTAAALVYPVVRRRTRGSGRRPPLGREELIDTIAALDDLHQAGGIDEGAYRRQRARYMRQLRELAVRTQPTEHVRTPREGGPPPGPGD
jgi:hypothetical protein